MNEVALYEETFSSSVLRAAWLFWLLSGLLLLALLVSAVTGRRWGAEQPMLAALTLCITAATFIRTYFASGRVMVTEDGIMTIEGRRTSFTARQEILSWAEKELFSTRRRSYVLEDERRPEGGRIYCYVRPDHLPAVASSVRGVIVRTTTETDPTGFFEAPNRALYVPTQDPQALCAALERMKYPGRSAQTRT